QDKALVAQRELGEGRGGMGREVQLAELSEGEAALTRSAMLVQAEGIKEARANDVEARPIRRIMEMQLGREPADKLPGLPEGLRRVGGDSKKTNVMSIGLGVVALNEA